MRLKDRVAVITGAGSGMGRAMATLFAREGARVLVADINEAGGKETVQLVERAGGQARFVRANMGQVADVRSLMEETVRTFGRIDVMVNNAGIPMPPTRVEDVPEELVDRLLAVNVRGVFLGCKYVVPIMKRQGSGVIINIGSTGGIRPRPGLTAYNMTKGAVHTLTKNLALELAPAIRVNAIAPVASDTPMLSTFMGNRDPEEGRKAFIATIPLGRLSRPEDIANAALYLASDEASMVTGIVLEVDGGRDV